MPVTLPNLYCKPGDVMDVLGVEGAQLRVDDHQLATGQTITVTANAAPLDTTLYVAPLTAPLISGTVLQFDGASMPARVEVTLSATAPTGTTALTVLALSASVNALAAAQDSGVNVALAALLVKGCQYATGRVKFYCCTRYDDNQLVNSWSVNRWATALAAQWVCRRRSQSAPKSIDEDVKEVLAEMKGVAVGAYSIEDIGTRTSGWPFFVNTTVNLNYEIAKTRVEPSISEGTPVQYGQFIDWNSALILEW
jgi:hypothetical protein